MSSVLQISKGAIVNSQGFDSKLLVTIALTFFVFIGYQMYLKKKYPNMDKPAAASENTLLDSGQTNLETQNNNAENKTGIQRNSAPESSSKLVEEKTMSFEDSNWTVVFSSKGMSVKKIVLKNYTTREGENIEFEPSAGGNFSTNLVGRRTDLNFALEKTSATQIIGRAYDGQMKISKTVTLDSVKNVFNTMIRVEKVADNFIGLTTQLNKDIVAMNSGFSLIPSFENQEVYYMQDEEAEHEILGGDESRKEISAKSPVAGLTTQYFAVAMTDKSEILPELLWTYTPKGEGKGVARTTWTHNMLNKSTDFSVRYIAYAGPKAYDHLHEVDEALAGIVNFGFFNALAVMLYHLLQFIFEFVGNWGFAIIIMTALFRLVVLPLNVMSYKSMKVMSKVQPQVKEIQKKYADDRERANQEVMKLMKENGANPLGGCLPMLLQIPIFFALYQVLGQSIELYKAPFILWITDLSAKDPYFVIPVLMTATMFAQQKLTPSTMEPAQQKIMMFMLLGFSVFFIALPAGLTLYMFISTLFGVLQQVYFLRDKKAEATA